MYNFIQVLLTCWSTVLSQSSSWTPIITLVRTQPSLSDIMSYNCLLHSRSDVTFMGVKIFFVKRIVNLEIYLDEVWV